MKLTGIKDIYYDMRDQEVNRCQFEFTYAQLDFDVIFKIDCKPFVLMFGIKINNEYFEIEVDKGFEINDQFDNDVYSMLVKLFVFSGQAWEPFKPIHFFSALNDRIPENLKGKNYYKPSTMARYYRNVEESEKIYFIGWIDHDELRAKNPNYDKNVTPENLIKTKKLLSEKAYYRCKEDNISSKWSDIPHKENLTNMSKYD